MINKKKKFLALTALQSFWDLSKPIVFLGEWCRPLWEKKTWDHLDGELLQHPDLDKANSYEAYQYTIEIYESLMPQIARWFNNIHNTQYSEKYWRIIAGPFLLFYIQAMHYRFVYLKSAFSVYEDIETIGLDEGCYKTPQDSLEFLYWVIDSETWNLQLFTQILNACFTKPVKYSKSNWEDEVTKSRKRRSDILPEHSKKTKTKIYFLKLFTNIFRKRAIGIHCTHFRKETIKKFFLLSKFRILPIEVPLNKQPIKERAINHSIRNTIANIPTDDVFIKLILDTLVTNLPSNFIENYHDICLDYQKRYPTYMNAVITDTLYQDDTFKFWLAKISEQKCKVIHLQHGGGYGCLEYVSSEYLERSFDGFISWGWGEQHKEVQPFPASLISTWQEYKPWGNRPRQGDLILWLANGHVANYLPFFVPHPFNNAHYLKSQSDFYHNIEKSIIKNVTLRLPPASKLQNYIKDLFPAINVSIPNNRDSFIEQLYQTKICVVDVCQTVFLYALAFNIPTILFWDKNVVKLRPEAQPFFDELERVGIFHSSPESAARMLNKIADNPEPWWSSAEVQQARQIFCNNFAKTSKNWIKDWVRSLVKLGKSSTKKELQ